MPQAHRWTVHLVPHTHYDVVWAFNEEDYLQINERILRKAARMVRQKEFRFLIEQTYLLEQVERRYPRLFADLKWGIQEGRIEIADGTYLMPDTMLTHGETIVRGILWGKRYARDRFGVEVPVAWCADGFGLNAQMPQIYRRSGYRWVAFRRGAPRAVGERGSEFRWRGLDGTEILAHWFPAGYRAGLVPDQWDETIERLKRKATTSHILLPCGSGSTPPVDDVPDRIDLWNKTHEDTRIEPATPSAFFRAVEAEAPTLATHEGELYRPDLENVFQDVATTRIGFKTSVRRLERSALLAERLGALSHLQGHPYPAGRLEDAWRLLLYLGFHDVIAGTCIDEVHEALEGEMRRVQASLSPVTEQAARTLVLDDSIGDAVAVFNPHPWAVRDWVEVDVALEDRRTGPPGLVLDGAEIPTEVLELERWDDGSPKRARLGFVADGPPMGWRLYELVRRGPEPAPRASLDDGWVVTPFHRVRLDPASGVLEVQDLQHRPLVAGNDLRVDVETGDVYFQRNPLEGPIGTERQEGGLRFCGFKPARHDVAVGPVRTVLTLETTLFGMRWPYRLQEQGVILHRHPLLGVRKQVILYHDLPRIDLVTELDHRCPNVCIRARFDTGLPEARWTRETQFGATDVPSADGASGPVKVPCLAWVHAAGPDRGVAFLSRGPPFHEIRGPTVDLTLLRSVTVLSSDGKSGPFLPVPGAAELGRHRFETALLPHDGGSWADAGVARAAKAYRHPLLAYQVDTDPAGRVSSLLELAPESLVLTAFKRAEDGQGFVARFHETTGQPCRARIRLPPAVSRVQTADLLEQPQHEVAVASGMAELDVGPFEIVTLRLSV